MLSSIIALFVVLADQISKYFVRLNLKPAGNIKLIEGIIDFTYVENKGAAFGMLSDNRAVFLVFSVVIIVLLCYIVAVFHGQSRLFDVCLGLIVGGGIGNMIDRIFLGYVVDFIDFCAFDFWVWVFNIADCAVVVGCILAIIFLVFDKKAQAAAENKPAPCGENDNEQ